MEIKRDRYLQQLIESLLPFQCTGEAKVKSAEDSNGGIRYQKPHSVASGT